MNERDESPFGTRARLIVYQPRPPGLQHRQDRADVVHAQRNVMHAGAAPGQVSRNRRFGIRAFEQLERGSADGDEVRAHLLRGYLLRGVHLQPERIPIERERLPDILDGDPDVIERGFHERAGPGAGASARAGALSGASTATVVRSTDSAAAYGSSSRASIRSMIRSISSRGTTRS